MRQRDGIEQLVFHGSTLRVRGHEAGDFLPVEDDPDGQGLRLFPRHPNDRTAYSVWAPSIGLCIRASKGLRPVDLVADPALRFSSPVCEAISPRLDLPAATE